MTRALAFLAKHRADVLTAGAWLAGWFLLTWGLDAIVSGQWSAAVWRLSLGALAVCLGGPRLLWAVLTNGLYTLSRDTAPPARPE